MANPDGSASSDQRAELQILRAENEALRDDLRRINSSLRLRAATILTEGVRSPRALIPMLGQLWSLGREVVTVRAWRRIVLGLECGLPEDVLRDVMPGPNTGPAIKALSHCVFKKPNFKCPAQNIRDPAVIIALKRLEELHRIATSNEKQTTPETEQPVEGISRRILMALHTGEPDQTNGYARRSHEILTALSAADWDMKAALRPPRGDSTIKCMHAKLYHRIGRITPLNDGLDSYVEAYAQRLLEDIYIQRPVLVHAASNHITGRAAAIAARKAGLPFVYEVRGLWEETRRSVEPIYASGLGYCVQRKLEIDTAKAADRLLVNGEPMADIFREAGVPADKIVQVPNGVHLAREPDAKEISTLKARWGLDARPIIGFAGSITTYEGLKDVLAACAQLKDIPFQLLFIGDGPDKSALQVEASRLGLGGRVTWTGRVSPDEVRIAYAFIDIAPLVRKDTPVTRLVPPLKPLDAMAGKAALVVSDLPPLAELAQNYGLIVPAGSPAALSASIRELLQNPKRRTAMTEAAHSWVCKTRTWTQIAHRISNVYDELIEPRSTPALI